MAPGHGNSEFIVSTCPHDCPSACALEVERLSGRTVGKLRGLRGHSYTAGVVCAKVARYRERVHHPDRLTEPLLRVGAKGAGRDAFRPITWDEALDRVAEALLSSAKAHGAETVWPYHYAGTMGLVQRHGILRLTHAMGYSRLHSTICSTLADAGWRAGVGTVRGSDPRDMAEADLIVVWGGNPVATQVNAMHHIAKARKRRGARLVVVDPYRTATAAVADRHIALRPGTDGALAAAMMHVMFRDGAADLDYMAEWTDDPVALETHLAAKTPDWAAAITGLPVEEIEAFAAEFGGAERTFLRLGYGFSRSRNGAANMHAVCSLATVGGKWRQRGGGALYANFDLYPIDYSLITGSDHQTGRARKMDQSRIGAILSGNREDLAGGPPVTAMLIQNTNPMVVCPELGLVHEGMAREDLFLCVHEQFMTETAAMADIVLPATTFVEHEDIYIGGGHSYLSVGPKIIEPLGEARSNHDTLCGLAKRLGAQHPGFEMSGQEIMEETLRLSGLPAAEDIHARGGIDMMAERSDGSFGSGFGHPDGKFHFRPDWAAIGLAHSDMPALPDHMPAIEAPDDETPYRLITPPSRQFLNSTFTETETSRALADRPTALMHPEDYAEIEVSEDKPVRLGNGRGSVLLHARPAEGQQRGVVVVEGVWPNNAFLEGIGINVLIGSDTAPPLGGAAFHDTAIWIRAE